LKTPGKSLSPTVTAPAPDSTDLRHAVARLGVTRQFRPEFGGVVHGDRQRTGRQKATFKPVGVEPCLDRGQHGNAAFDPQGGACLGVEVLVTGLGLDAVEPLDLGDIPSRRRAFAIDRFDELAPRMAPAGEAHEPRVLRRQGSVGDKAVALQPSGKTLQHLQGHGVRPSRVVPVAIVATLIIHTGFYKLLKVPLPWGLLQPIAW